MQTDIARPKRRGRRLGGVLAASILGLGGSLWPEPLAACSFWTATAAFRPSLEGFDWHPADRRAPVSPANREPVPAPVVHEVKLTRAEPTDPTSCGDTAVLRLSIAPPYSSSYDLDRFGIYVRKLSGRVPDETFPAVPLKSPVVYGRSELLFFWLDWLPVLGLPLKLNLKLEVFFVTDGLDIGPSTIFQVKE